MTAVLETFLEIVQIDSPTGEEAAFATHIVQWLQEHCAIEAEIDAAGNVFCRARGTGEAIFLSAHMDTVEPGRSIHPQLSEDGWLTSDGSTILGADNKTSVAALLCALEWYALQPLSTRRPLEVLFTVSEESENRGAVAFDHSQLSARVGYIFDASLPVGTVISQSPYYARYDIDIVGRGAHASDRTDSIPVLESAITCLSAIEALRRPELLINTGLLSGGTARNTVMGDIHIHGEIRSYDETSFLAALDAVRSLHNTESQPSVLVDTYIENPGYVHQPAALQRLQDWMLAQTGRAAEIQPSYGCSDGNIFCSWFPVYCCGSGDVDPHTVRERVHVDELELLQQVYCRLMIVPPDLS